MIPRDCKRLAEVDFPIAEVSKHAAREKSIHRGHPSTLHLWWARRPLASSRAVLLGLLWPDPCDPLCPDEFKVEARSCLGSVGGCHPGKTDQELRTALLRFIADFANWDNAAKPLHLEVSRTLVRAAHGGEPPLVVDPFAGGGSIPLEALRVGCDAFASDLNPVACLILKVLLEDIPRHGRQLAEDLRHVGAEIKQRAGRELANLYPKDPDGETPIAYLWARTVRCEAPNCGAEIPLMRSFWLCKKKRMRALRPRVMRPKDEPPYVDLEVFEPHAAKDVSAGTVDRAKATCLCCNTVLPPERVRAQLVSQRGGADTTFDAEGCRVGGARLLAVVLLKPGVAGRHYRIPTERDYEAVRRAQVRVATMLEEWERDGRQGPCPVPDEPLPPIGTLGFRVQRYGMLQWGDLFTARQKLSLLALRGCIVEPGRFLTSLLACAFSRVAMSNMTCTRWNAVAEKMQHTFGRQALPIVWDFAEVVITADAPGNWKSGYELIAEVIEMSRTEDSGQTQAGDAAAHPLPDETAQIWFTDPPYYDAVPYADLADFFFVWLKRTLPEHPLLRDPNDPANPLSPKLREAVQDETKRDNGRVKDRTWFEETMAKAFAEGRRVLHEDGVGSVVFAHKTTEGWEALLSGMIRGGWTITGSWPIATEMGSRLRARDSAALATSIHLICRPRADNDLVGDWVDVLRELPERVGQWMERLQEEGVRGADLVFACIGPALEVFSRYSRVEDAAGREIALGGNPEAGNPHERGYLAFVWEAVGRAALEQVLGGQDSALLEEDARLTALFLWTQQSTNRGNGQGSAVAGSGLPFDVVRRFAQPLGIHLPDWEDRAIRTEKGVVHLVPVRKRAAQLFGREGAAEVAARIGTTREIDPQLTLFPDGGFAAVPTVKGRGRRAGKKGPVGVHRNRDATTLDRLHAAMLLQDSGQSAALRALLEAERDRGPGFLTLANALSALYPDGSTEERLLDAMLLAMPR